MNGMKSVSGIGRFAVCIGLLLPALPCVVCGNSGGYRGPERNGVFPARGLLSEWPEGGPELLWSTDQLGWGYSSPTVANGMVYVTGQHPETRIGHLFAFTLEGALKWTQPYGPEFGVGRCSGPRGSVTVSDGVLIVPNAFNGQCSLYAFEEKTGKPLWHAKPGKTLTNQKMSWGYNETPLVMGDNVYITLVGRNTNTPPVVAFNKYTGDIVWKAALPDNPKGYSAADGSIIGFEHNGRKLLVAALYRANICLDAESGKLIWKQDCRGNAHQCTPVYNDGYLLLPDPEKRAKEVTVYKLSDDGSEVTPLWSMRTVTLAQALLMDGRAYLLRREKPNRTFACVEIKTGKVLQEEPAPDSGSLVAAEGLIYWLIGGGAGMGTSNEYAPGYAVKTTIRLVRPTAEGFEIVSEFNPKRGLRDSWIHPTIAEGRLWHRHQPLLAVYDLRSNKPAFGFRHDGTGHAPHAFPLVNWWHKNVQWTTPLERPGNGPAVVVGTNAFLTAGSDTLVCIDPETGSPRWSRQAAKGSDTAACSTPLVDLQTKCVYAVFGNGTVACYDWQGAEQWSRAIEAPGASGVVLSPLRAGTTLIVQLKDLHALDLLTGKPVWKAPLPDVRVKGAPILATIGDVKAVITAAGVAVSAADGSRLADDLPSSPTAPPLVSGHRLFLGGTALDMRAEGAKKVTFKRLWSCDLDVVCSLAHGDVLYLLTESAELAAVESATGKAIYRQKLGPGRAGASAELLAAGDRMYAVTGSRPVHVTVFKAGRHYQELQSFRVRSEAAAVSFAAARLFVRSVERLYTIGGSLPGKPEKPSVTRVLNPKPLEQAPADGAMVAPFKDDVVLDDWLMLGPFNPSTLDIDFLASAGGAAKVRGKLGEAFAFVPAPATGEDPDCEVPRGVATNCTWHVFDKELLRWQDNSKWAQGYNTISLRMVAGSRNVPRGSWKWTANRAETWYFYTELNIEKERVVQFHFLTPNGHKWITPEFAEAKVWVSGVPLDMGSWRDGLFFRAKEAIALRPGRYPVMMQVAIGRRMRSWDRLWAAPRFVTSEHAAADAAGLKAYQAAMNEWSTYQKSLEAPQVLDSEVGRRVGTRRARRP